MVESFKNDPTYAKEKVAYNEDLKECIAAAKAVKHEKEFYREFVLKSTGDIRKSYPDPTTFTSNCTAFTNAM